MRHDAPMPPTRPIRVVALVDRLAAGGAERVACELAAGLDPTRFERAICAGRWPATVAAPQGAERAEQLRADGVEVIEVHRTGKADLWRWGPLVEHLRRRRVDVLHGHMLGSSLWAGVLGRLAGVPVSIAHEHGWPGGRAPFRATLDRLVVGRLCAAYVAVSDADAGRLVADHGVPSERVVVIPNGIDPPKGDPSGVREALGLGPGNEMVVAVGRLHPHKDLATLVRAVGLLAARRPALRLLVAGDGEERTGLAALAASEAPGVVRLLGDRDDVPALLAAADAWASSSATEGTPLALLEAMAAGLPIVATDVGGVPDVVRDGREAVLVAPGDPGALAGALDRVLTDRGSAAGLGRAARERHAARYGRAAMVGRVEALYEELVANASASRSAT